MDKLGRWASVTLKDDIDGLMTVIAAYRCNPGNESNGDGTFWYHQHCCHFAAENMKKEKNIDYIDPQAIMLKDLQQYINQKQEKKHKIVLMMDANQNSELGGDIDKFFLRHFW